MNPFLCHFRSPSSSQKLFFSQCVCNRKNRSKLYYFETGRLQKLTRFQITKRASLQTVVLDCGSSTENTLPLMRYAESIFFYFAGNNDKLFAKFQNVERITNSTALISFFSVRPLICFSVISRGGAGMGPNHKTDWRRLSLPIFHGQGETQPFFNS